MICPKCGGGLFFHTNLDLYQCHDCGWVCLDPEDDDTDEDDEDDSYPPGY